MSLCNKRNCVFLRDSVLHQSPALSYFFWFGVESQWFPLKKYWNRVWSVCLLNKNSRVSIIIQPGVFTLSGFYHPLLSGAAESWVEMKVHCSSCSSFHCFLANLLLFLPLPLLHVKEHSCFLAIRESKSIA